ncbi:hypothetical protein [Christiangramia echinicola]|uniref:Uncharacterized protein n=1 Tax=Christiangramia echinicola TaxID=279359 RepID=A0A1H1MM50_9FLAO|nr:hypothetical protein [Christiangramia echinicola]SDR87881.1 hypothetical protein SAMN04488552_1366 [Christiangramia echinicola]
MRLAITLFTSFFLLLQTSCSSGRTHNEEKYYGIIKPAGITTYQYGTHRLETQNDFYALKSDTVNLEEYEGQEVEIMASHIEGYAVDGGPVYLLVTKVKN